MGSKTGIMTKTFFLKNLWAFIIIIGQMIPSPSWADSIRVFAASSLTNPLGAIITKFTDKTGIDVQHSFAASSILARQIINGAPVDIFISANASWMDEVAKNNLLYNNNRRVVASNTIALIANKEAMDNQGVPPPAHNTIDVDNPLVELLSGNHIAIGDPAHVPAGIYTKQSLQKFGFWKPLQTNFIGMPNVRAALTFVERGEALFGFVYASDVQFSKKITLIGLLPIDSHDAIEYTAGIVTDRQHPNIESFMEYLETQEAQKIFLDNGFLRPTN